METLTRVTLYTAPRVVPSDEIVPSQDGILSGLAFCRNWLARHDLDARRLVGASVRGNTMEPTIRNGDSVLIDVGARELQDGDVYAFCDGDALIIKRLQRQPGGKVRMISDNPLYPMIEVPIDAVHAVGRVVWRGSLL